MQYVDGFIELSDVHHTINCARVPDSNLSRTGAHLVERLPVGRLKPSLDLPQLETRFLPGVFWESQQIVIGRPYPTDLLLMVRTIGMYTILYALRVPNQGAR
jgi:hypothetical protein